MEEKKIFAIALSFSLAWHLLGGEAVHIVWPEKIPEHKFAPIIFWGSLVDVHNLNTKADDSDLNMQPDMDFNILTKEALPIAELSEKKDPVIITDSIVSEEFHFLGSMKGEVKRSILLKPALPIYPEWAKELGNYFEIELKFLILADGTVGSVKKVTSAGYPELDEIGIRYIRKWKFMPLPEGEKPAEQWGTVKLVFNLK